MKKYENFFKFLKLNLKYRCLGICAGIAMLLCASMSAISPVIVMKIIDNISKNNEELTKIISLFIITYFLKILSKLVSDYSFSIIGKRVIKELKMNVMSHLYKLDGEYLNNINIGEHLNILDGDIKTVEYIATKTLFSLISDLLTILFTLIVLFSIQSEFMIYIIIIQSIIVLIQIYSNNKVISLRKRFRRISSKLTDIQQEMLTKIIDIIELKGLRLFFNKYTDRLDEYTKINLKLDLTCGLNIAAISFLDLVCSTFIFAYGAYKVSLNQLTVGGLIALISYADKIFSPVLRIISSNMQIQQAIIAIDKIFCFLKVESNIKNLSSTECSIIENISIEECAFKYNLQSKSLYYDGICFNKNSINILMGQSGIGKTTIIKLLYRFWDVNEGSINLNGKNINQYDIISLRNNISVVPQHPLIINDTIINNITLKNEVNKKYIYEVCKAVDIHDFINTLPNKYDTLIGSDGINLSGGQIQRISIARALVRKSNVLIMDEPTSSLDEQLEKKVLENVYKFLKERTTIIITHRKEVLKYADKIYDFKLKKYNKKEAI